MTIGRTEPGGYFQNPYVALAPDGTRKLFPTVEAGAEWVGYGPVVDIVTGDRYWVSEYAGQTVTELISQPEAWRDLLQQRQTR